MAPLGTLAGRRLSLDVHHEVDGAEVHQLHSRAALDAIAESRRESCVIVLKACQAAHLQN